MMVVVLVFHIICGASASGVPVGFRSGLFDAPAGAVGNSGNEGMKKRPNGRWRLMNGEWTCSGANGAWVAGPLADPSGRPVGLWFA
jgi:hypothetical protein